MKGSLLIPGLALAAMLCGGPGAGARAASSSARERGIDCLPWTPIGCPSDFRTTPVTGPAARGYTDPTSGLRITVDRAFTGTVTLDEGCFGPGREYELYLHVAFHTPRRHPVTFDLVGLTVRESPGGTFNLFDWGGATPSHATSLGPGKTKAMWLPYYIDRPSSFSVRWRLVYPGYGTAPTEIARFRAIPTGVRACGR